MSRALIVGYGSIGARHARILTEMGHEVAIVSRRTAQLDTPLHYADLQSALPSFGPDYVVIANRTAEHDATLSALVRAGFGGQVLVEKPLYEEPKVALKHTFSGLFVAYNLRFHPVLQRLRDLLKEQKVLTVHVYVGQYLPTWRPQTDYRDSYSAKYKQGGGVLRDLSHELDYLSWLFQGWNRVAAIGGHFSTLAIDSDDAFSLLLETSLSPVVSLNMNYLDRIGRRSILINTDMYTIEADLVAASIKVDGQLEIITSGRDDSYRSMHAALLEGSHADLCTYEQGMEVMNLIAASEAAALNQKWVSR